MTHQEINRLFAFTEWANHLVLDASIAVPTEDLQRDFGAGHHSITQTLTHMYGAERIWFERWQRLTPQPFAKPEDYGSLEHLRDDWSRLEKNRSVWLAEQSDASFEAPLEYANLRGERFAQPLQDQIQHAVNHATHHRGQVVAFLRALGVRPPTTDFIHYLRITA